MEDIYKEMICDVRYIDGVRASTHPKSDLIRCKDCEQWDTADEEFKDFDDCQWHECKELAAFLSASGDVPRTPEYHYCGWSKEKQT